MLKIESNSITSEISDWKLERTALSNAFISEDPEEGLLYIPVGKSYSPVWGLTGKVDHSFSHKHKNQNMIVPSENKNINEFLMLIHCRVNNKDYSVEILASGIELLYSNDISKDLSLYQMFVRFNNPSGYIAFIYDEIDEIEFFNWQGYRKITKKGLNDYENRELISIRNRSKLNKLKNYYQKKNKKSFALVKQSKNMRHQLSNELLDINRVLSDNGHAPSIKLFETFFIYNGERLFYTLKNVENLRQRINSCVAI